MSLPTSLTLAEAAMKIESVGEAVFYPQFSVAQDLHSFASDSFSLCTELCKSLSSVCDHWEFYVNSGVGF